MVRALVLAILLVYAGCRADSPPVSANGDGTNDVGADTTDGEILPPNSTLNGSNSLNGREEYCAGEGPPIVVGDQPGTSESVCSGELAAVTFRYALCVCEDLITSAPIATDSFDSRAGPYDAADAKPGGALGVNGRLFGAEPLDLGGTCWVGGDGISLDTVLGVGFRLHSAGSLVAASAVIADDAWVGGDVAVPELSVGGTLHLPESADYSSDAEVDMVREPVDVPLPCGCDDPIDVASFVEANREKSHNGEEGIDPELLSGITEPTSVDLDCGRYYFSEIAGLDDVTFNVEGRVAVFVGGDVSGAGQVEFALSDDAEVDVFVAGDVTLSAPLVLGNERRPSRARLYVGGSTFALHRDSVVAGNVYAPSARISATGRLEVFGSLFVDEIATSQALTIHYDTAVLRAGEECPEPDGEGTCRGCEDCNNQACLDGRCTACRIAADCCTPLVCVEGECVPYAL